MVKRIFQRIYSLMMAFLVIAFLSSLAAADTQQYGSPKGAPQPSEGALGPVKENICKNPKLCESLEIDMLSDLQKDKAPIYLPKPQTTSSTQGYKVALNLGIAVTDALSAIINQDKGAFLQYAEMIEEYGKKLEISEAVLGKYNQIVDVANKGEWVKLETLTYEFKDAITEELNAKNRKGEATLAMVAGALEGLHIEALALEKQFSPKAAIILHNKEFVDYLVKNMNSLDEGLKAKAEVKAIADSFPQLGEILKQPKSYEYSKKDVEKLLKIMQPLRNTIMSG